jgi:ABC-type uncharacterized transport system involved in gliding motility auxiliary subunit
MADADKTKRFKYASTLSIISVLVMIIAVNIISAHLFFRLDITAERLYTLSQGSRDIVGRIDTPTVIKYYFTRNLASLPLVYKNYGQRIEELLREYRNLNPENLVLEVYDPTPDSDEEEWAEKYGLTGIELGTGERLFMGIVITREDREINLPIMDPRRENYLEYDITQLLQQIAQKKDKIVGILSSLPVMGMTASRFQQMQGQNSLPKWVFVQELEKTFEIRTIEPSVTDIDSDINILIVIHPKNLSEQALYAIDQFVLRGGETVILVDPNARVDQEAAMMAQMGQMPQASSDLAPLFQHWGIDYQPNQVLGDLDRPTRVNAGGSIGTISYALWQTLTGQSFNQELIATRELHEMLIVEPGGFMMSDNSPLSLQPLISSSSNAGLVDAQLTRFSDPLTINKEIKPDGEVYTLAGILTGKLTSAFEKRPPAPESKEAEPAETPSRPIPSHLSAGTARSSILLITDVDFIADHFAVEQFNLLGQVFSQPRNDNLNFLVNMVEFLGGAEEMMAIRSRGRFSRPFTRFLTLERDAQAQYQAAESRLTTKLQEVQERLSELDVPQETNRIVLTKEQIEKIRQFREEEKKTKDELRQIRKLLRQDIEKEKTTLTLLNLMVVPVLLVLFGLFLYYRRFRGRKTS